MEFTSRTYISTYARTHARTCVRTHTRARGPSQMHANGNANKTHANSSLRLTHGRFLRANVIAFCAFDLKLSGCTIIIIYSHKYISAGVEVMQRFPCRCHLSSSTEEPATEKEVREEGREKEGGREGRRKGRKEGEGGREGEVGRIGWKGVRG